MADVPSLPWVAMQVAAIPHAPATAPSGLVDFRTCERQMAAVQMALSWKERSYNLTAVPALQHLLDVERHGSVASFAGSNKADRGSNTSAVVAPARTASGMEVPRAALPSPDFELLQREGDV